MIEVYNVNDIRQADLETTKKIKATDLMFLAGKKNI